MNIRIQNIYDDTTFVYSGENELDLESGDQLVFSEKEGMKQVGKVISLSSKKTTADEITLDGKIWRKVNDEDFEKIEDNAKKAEESLKKAREKITELDLKMKFVEARLSFESGEVNFFFTAEDRIDFREVVPKIAGILRKRIHLTQLGMRDKAKACGGFGICGREMCCSNGVISKFKSVTMEMVKIQELGMKNADKLSGPCGKLLCCLAYELDEYKKMRAKMPAWGSVVKTEKGEGKVISLDILNQSVKVWLEKGGAQVFPADAVKLVKR